MATCSSCHITRVMADGGVCDSCKMKAGFGGLKPSNYVKPPSAQGVALAGPQLLRAAVVGARVGPPTLDVGTLPAGTTLSISFRARGEVPWHPVAGTLFVLKDTHMEFQVISHGGDPTLIPLIRLEGAQWTGLATSRGKLAPVNCTTNTANALMPNVLTVAYGGQSASANVVIYSVNITAALRDNFGGRIATELGVCEDVDLGFTTNPLGITAVQAGGLRWQFEHAAPADLRTLGTFTTVVGALPAPVDGTARFRAPYATHPAGALVPAHSDVTIQLCVVAGPSHGTGPTKTYKIHKPQAHMTQEAGTMAHHWNSGGEEPSAGFTGVFHFTPKTVSFSNIGFREGTGNMKSDGVCAGDEHGLAHATTASIVSVGTGNVGTGCTPPGGVSDNVHSASTYSPDSLLTVNGGTRPTGSLSPRTRVGGKQWPIVWEYTYSDITTGVFAATFVGMQKAYHELTVYESGRAVMDKGHKGCADCTAHVDIEFGKGAAHYWP